MDQAQLDKLFASLKLRTGAEAGIRTASDYVSAFRPLLAGDTAQIEKYFGFGTAQALAAAVKDAGKKLTYQDDGMVMLKSYKGESLIVPDSVKSECRRGKKWDRKLKAATAADLEICGHLLERRTIDPAKVTGSLKWFERHSKDADRDGWDEGDKTYPCPERVRHAVRGGDPAAKWLKRVKADVKDDESGIEDGACMEFDCVLTSKNQDRDGDVLEPEGAIVDSRMPLLWQHIPIQPIGKLLKVLDQDDERVKVRFAVCDSSLGRDAAQLVTFGALRISHGFVPLEFEPLEEDADNAGGDDKGANGWHVLKYKVLEGSVVSIPSNPDAVITAYSRKCLRHPLVERWAKGFFDRRRPLVRSGFDRAGGPPVHVHVHMTK